MCAVPGLLCSGLPIHIRPFNRKEPLVFRDYELELQASSKPTRTPLAKIFLVDSLIWLSNIANFVIMLSDLRQLVQLGMGPAKLPQCVDV